WSLTRVNTHEFSGENALMKPAVTASHHRFAISRQFDGDPQSRRYDIPLKQRSQTADDCPCRMATVISCRKIRTDRPAVIETGPKVYSQAVADENGIVYEYAAGVEFTASEKRSTINCLVRGAIIILVILVLKHAIRRHHIRVMVAVFKLCSCLE